MGWDALGINVQLAVPVLDELMEAISSVVIFVRLKVIVKNLVNGFDARHVSFHHLLQPVEGLPHRRGQMVPWHRMNYNQQFV